MKKIIVITVTVFSFLIGNHSFAQEIEWINMNEVEAKVQEEPRKVLVYVTAKWCGWCKRMEKGSFVNKEVIEYLNKNFYNVKVDGEDRNTIKFQNHDFKFISSGRRGYNELAYSLLDGKLNYPALVFFQPDFKRITIASGYRSATEISKLATFIFDEVYKTTAWQEYEKATKGE